MRFAQYISTVSILVLIAYVVYNESKSEPHSSGEEITDSGSINVQARSLPIPEYMEFAGEAVPLDQFDVRERFDRELHINTYWHNNTIFLIKRANRWMPEIERILQEEGVPLDFKYIPAIEGQFLNDISPKQAVGFWQIRRNTGLELGLEVSTEVDERYDPIKSTYAACKYFKKAYEKFGNWTLAAATYNRGIAGISRALDHQKVNNYYDLLLNDETSRYIFRILAIKQIISNPELYNFDINQEHLYDPFDLEYITVDETIPDLVEFAKIRGITYKNLKQYNPWLRRDQLTVRQGTEYKIAIPAAP